MAEPYTDERLRTAIQKARIQAQSVGPLHAAWDVIFDGEALLSGKETYLQGSRDDLMKILTDSLETG